MKVSEMDKRFRVSGLFNLEVEGRDSREAKTKARRILRDSGIDGCVIDVEEVEECVKE